MAIKIQANILQDLSRAAEILGRGLLTEQERQLNKQEMLQQFERDKKKMEYELATNILSNPQKYDKPTLDSANNVIRSYLGTDLNPRPKQLSLQEQALGILDKHPAAIMKFLEGDKETSDFDKQKQNLELEKLRLENEKLKREGKGKGGVFAPDESWSDEDKILWRELQKIQD